MARSNNNYLVPDIDIKRIQEIQKNFHIQVQPGSKNYA